MRFVRVRLPGELDPVWAEDRGETLAVLSAPPWVEGHRRSQREVSSASARFLAPAVPSKVVCVGRNYAAHARELGNDVPSEPLLFLKPPSSVIGSGDAIERPVGMSSLVHHEGELAVVLGACVRHAREDDVMRCVFGYTIANDVTARDVQRKENKFTRAKGFDTFCPLGPALVTADALADPQDLTLTVRVDDEVRQEASTRDMIFPVAALLAFISRVMTLEPGDVVLTGTPEGVGPLEAGQVVRVTVPGIGTLENPVVDEVVQR